MRYDPVPAPSFYRHSTSASYPPCHLTPPTLRNIPLSFFTRVTQGTHYSQCRRTWAPPETCVFSRLRYNSGPNVSDFRGVKGSRKVKLVTRQISSESEADCIDCSLKAAHLRESEIVRIEGGSHYRSFDSGQSSVPLIVTAT